MKELLLTLVQALVDHTDEVAIDEEVQGGNCVLKVRVHPDDMGKVIGKQGRTVRAIRSVMQAAASVRNLRARVEILDEKR